MYIFMDELENVLELIEAFNTNKKVEKVLERIQNKSLVIKNEKTRIDGIDVMEEKKFKEKIHHIATSNLETEINCKDENILNELILTGLMYSKEFDKFFFDKFGISRLEVSTTTNPKIIGIEKNLKFLGFNNILNLNFFGTISKIKDKLVIIIFTIKDGQLEFTIIDEFSLKAKIDEKKILKKILSQISNKDIVEVNDELLIKGLSSTLNYVEDIAKKPIEVFLNKIGG